MGNRHVICSSNPVDVDLYTLRVGDDAQRANGKKSDSKPEERISKRHSLPPRGGDISLTTGLGQEGHWNAFLAGE